MFIAFIFAALSLGLVSCEPSEPATSNKVKTGKATNITQNSALLHGEVDIDISAYDDVEFGVMIATNIVELNARMGDVYDAEVLIGKDFEVQLNGLSADTKYYYCAWLFLNNMQYEFGEIKTFETLSANDSNTSNGGSADYNGHAYVDLGLPSGLKWATCNVGATKPEEYGNYYAWGETEPKTTYEWSTYKWCNGSKTTLTKYNTESDYGTVDNKTVLDLADDAARANWGGAWRMPTDAEWTELRNNCTWTWTDDYNGTGVKGRIVTSNINGNSIFLPAAGYRCYDYLNYAGSGGYFWSSSLCADYPGGSWSVGFSSDRVNRYYNDRCYGQSVRPVL